MMLHYINWYWCMCKDPTPQRTGYKKVPYLMTIHVKSPSLGGRLPLFDPISLLNIHLPPRNGNLPLFESNFLPIIFSLKRGNVIEFCNENALPSQQSIYKVQ